LCRQIFRRQTLPLASTADRNSTNAPSFDISRSGKFNPKAKGSKKFIHNSTGFDPIRIPVATL
jgi:hypothetical protein